MNSNLHLELLGRLLLGGVLGAIIGYERDLHGRPAGLRTHALVGLASSTFMVVSTMFVYFQGYGPNDLVGVDASRIAASVVSGIGFLAGGAILRTGITVQGLTTAAGLWLVAAIGLAAGGGMYLVSAVATLAGVITLTLLRRLEDKVNDPVNSKLSLGLADDQSSLNAATDALTKLNVKLSQVSYERDVASGKRVFEAMLSLPSQLDSQELLKTLEALPGVQRVRLDVLR
ncbi:MAG: MgtC/SapB family protein [Archangium sp.]